MVRLNYGRQNNVYKFTMIFVCVHQRIRGGGRKCNQHILHCTGYIEIYKLRALLVNNGWLDFSNFKVFVEFSADKHRLNGGPDF